MFLTQLPPSWRQGEPQEVCKWSSRCDPSRILGHLGSLGTSLQTSSMRCSKRTFRTLARTPFSFLAEVTPPKRSRDKVCLRSLLEKKTYFLWKTTLPKGSDSSGLLLLSRFVEDTKTLRSAAEPLPEEGLAWSSLCFSTSRTT